LPRASIASQGTGGIGGGTPRAGMPAFSQKWAPYRPAGGCSLH
jgi:hypothetical protein